MKQRKNNDLIKLTLNGEIVGYYSSPHYAAMKSGKAQASILWHLAHTGTWKDFDDEVWTIEVVDGSKITYDMINN